MPVKTVITEENVGEFRPGGTFRDRDAQHSQHSYINDKHKYLWLGPGEFNPPAADSNITYGEVGGMGAWLFPDAGNYEGVFTALIRTNKWINGTIQLDLYCSESAAAGAQNMVLRTRVSSWAVGDTISGAYDRLDDASTVASQNSANKLFIYSLTTTAITSADDIFGISFERNPSDGSDNYTGILSFHGMLLTYIPTNRQ